MGLHLKKAKFQDSRKLGTHTFVLRTVTKGWWRGFSRRQAHRIVTKRGEKVACNRVDWTKMQNVRQMYDIIYDKLVEARVAISLDEPVFTDRDGKEVE